MMGWTGPIFGGPGPGGEWTGPWGQTGTGPGPSLPRLLRFFLGGSFFFLARYVMYMYTR